MATVANALFEVKKVVDGVWVAVAAPAWKVNCNTAIVEIDDGLLVVDSHSKPSAARAIVETIRAMTPKPVRYVVNTHFHWDHWQGNEAYPEAYPDVEVVTTAVTREAMLQKSLARVQQQIRTLPAEIEQLKSEVGAATTGERKAEIQENLRQAEAYLDEIRALRPALPTIAFERAMRFVDGKREIDLLYLGRAHTEGDVFVHLPREQVVITGDAVIGWTPFMGDAYPEDWVKTLAKLEALDFTHIIMGHGEVAGKEWLRFFRAYIEDVVAAVRAEAGRGATLDEIKRRVPDRLAPTYEAGLSKYGTYRPWRQRVLGNIERVYATAL